MTEGAELYPASNYSRYMLETLISSKTRINILLKFFLNPECTSYLRQLAGEFNESTNAIRLELNKFEEAGMLDTTQLGNRKMFKVNKDHPLYGEIRNILLKHIGIDQIIENVIEMLGNPKKVYLTGDFAKGMNGDIIDLIIIGEINIGYLVKLIEKAESSIQKKIRYLVYSEKEFHTLACQDNHMMLLWNH